MGMELTHDFSDHTGRFFIGFVMSVPHLPHRKEGTTMNRF